jgi:hypothetical protein
MAGGLADHETHPGDASNDASSKPSGKEATFWISKQFLREFKKKSPKQLDPLSLPLFSVALSDEDGLSSIGYVRHRVHTSTGKQGRLVLCMGVGGTHRC